MGNIFNQDFTEFIHCLNASGVEYMLVGGYATILHGYNRTTGDLDIWVNRTKDNYERIDKAFQQFQMPVFDMTLDKFLYDPQIDVFTFGRPPVCIDIMIKVKGLDFYETYKNSEKRVIENELTVNVIHLKGLISAKKAANRAKDQDDLAHLM